MNFYLKLSIVTGVVLLSSLALSSNVMAASTITASSARDMQSVANTAAASDSEPGVPVPPPSSDGQEPGEPAVPPSADGQEPGVAVVPPSSDLEPGPANRNSNYSNTTAISSDTHTQDAVLANDVAASSGVNTPTVTDSKSKGSRKRGSSKNKQ